MDTELIIFLICLVIIFIGVIVVSKIFKKRMEKEIEESHRRADEHAKKSIKEAREWRKNG